MTFVIAHISDTHLSDAKAHWVGNFDAVAADLRGSPPDLVINTGDVSLNGADLLDDLRAAHARHAALPMPWRAIPGNHDVGDNQEIARTQPANAERRARWLETFGPDWWMQDVPGWRLLGVNSLLLGSDIDAAAEQESFIAQAAASIDNRRLALFGKRGKTVGRRVRYAPIANLQMGDGKRNIGADADRAGRSRALT